MCVWRERILGYRYHEELLLIMFTIPICDRIIYSIVNMLMNVVNRHRSVMFSSCYFYTLLLSSTIIYYTGCMYIGCFGCGRFGN